MGHIFPSYSHAFRNSVLTYLQHLSDLTVIYNSHKRLHNVFISHCYGAIHTLRLLDTLKQEQRLAEVAGVVLLNVGIRAPYVSMLSSLPAFLLGELERGGEKSVTVIGTTSTYS